MDYKKLVLDMLLDKYEESRHYTGDARVNRRVALQFNKRALPQYDIENTDKKDGMHYALKSLEDRSIITIEWVKFEKGNIVDRVYLNVEHIEDAYREIGRKPKKDMVSDVISTLRELSHAVSTDWIRSFLEDQIREIEERKSLTKYIPPDEYLLGLLLSSLKGIDVKAGEEMLERVFSKRYLGGSKLFEAKVRSRLCTILREYFLESDDMEDAEALEAVGIIKTMEELLFYGPLKVKLFDQQIDFGLFRYGASMNTGMIRDFEVTGLDAAKVITIENKANFIEYIKREDIKDTLVVYLGGFYSPVKRVFLKKIYDYIESRGIDVSFQHWGDIDLGGFNIFIQLKSKLLDSLSPLYMDAETLRKYRSSAGKFESSYGKKLERLLHDERYAAFHEVINEMLKSSIKLEQEALL